MTSLVKIVCINALLFWIWNKMFNKRTKTDTSKAAVHQAYDHKLVIRYTKTKNRHFYLFFFYSMQYSTKGDASYVWYVLCVDIFKTGRPARQQWTVPVGVITFSFTYYSRIETDGSRMMGVNWTGRLGLRWIKWLWKVKGQQGKGHISTILKKCINLLIYAYFWCYEMLEVQWLWRKQYM